MTIAPPRALADLAKWPRWVVWRTVERDGKPTKVPFGPSGRPASSTDPGTWVTHAEAVSVAERGQYEGVGYVFAPDDEYAGIDLDHCIRTDGDRGFRIEPGAAKIIERLNSYTERSPSGTGVHILVRAGINGGRNRTKKTPWGGDFESYDRGRFFTVTGRHLPGTPETIEARQEELDAIRAELFPPEAKASPVLSSNGVGPSTLDDRDLLERAANAKNGADFDRLWRGDISGHGEDESAADLALCNMLAFWAGPDPARIDSLFRWSGLMRDKWDSARGESTYGAITIDKALAGRTEFYGQKTTRSVPASFEGRTEAIAASRARAAELLGLDDRSVVGGRSWGEDLDARVEIDISDGTTLVLKALGTYSAPAKLNALISFQIGGASALTQTMVNELFRHLRLICEFHGAVTLEGRAWDCGITFLQNAPEFPARMTDDQAERWKAMSKLAEIDPIALAKANGKSVSMECLVINSNGIRYVRASWFAAYAREFAGSSATAEQIVGRMVPLGWTQPGDSGRLKATQPGTGKALNWAFFMVPEGWETR